MPTTTVTSNTQGSREVAVARVAAAAVATIVLIDVAVVKAPFLAIVSLPFLVGAVGYRGRRTVSSIILALFALLFIGISVNFIAANGVDAIWSDLLFTYGGSVFALVLLVALGRTVAAGRRDPR